MRAKWRNTLASSCCSLLLTACAPSPQQWFQRSQVAYQHQNYGQAFNDARISAQYGHLKATYALGYMYYYGIGTQANPILARKWISKAAERGYQPAQAALNALYNTQARDPNQARLPLPQ